MENFSTQLIPEAKASDKDQNNSLEIIFVVGAPGVGKGTLCKKLAAEGNKFGYLHVSVGDYLREISRDQLIIPKPALGGMDPKELKASIEEQRLLDPPQIIAILKYKLEQEESRGWSKFVIDGFPRDEESAQLFENEVCSSQTQSAWDFAR